MTANAIQDLMRCMIHHEFNDLQAFQNGSRAEPRA